MTSFLKNDQNSLCELFNIRFPLIQAGMVWVSGGKLAGTCAQNGILGLVGAGSMGPELLKEQLIKAQKIAAQKETTHGAVGVNIPLLYSRVQEQIEVALDAGIRIFFTSAGSPKKYTGYLKDKGAIVVHVTSSPELAIKCEKAGVDAIVAEGFEAGGHNGRDEITTAVLIPQVVDVVKIPVIAAGGIVDGRGVLAAQALGASGVQMGTRFLATQESSAHLKYKQKVVEAGSDATILTMKDLVPVRLMRNDFYEKIRQLESKCASREELTKLLGKGRAKKGMLEGDLSEGELEIGQGCALVHDLPTVGELIERIINEYKEKLNQICSL